MTFERMAAAYEDARLFTARLSFKAHQQGQEGASLVLGGEARRLGRCRAALEVLAAECDENHTNSA